MKRPMKTGRWLLVGLFAFGTVTSAVAQVTAVRPELNDPSIPGSVLVFPYFQRGNVTVDGVLHPKTEIEINVSCPKDLWPCQEGARVKLAAHWVCPADQKPQHKFICKETDFVIQTTVDATVTLNPDNNPRADGFYQSSAPPQGGVRVAPCTKGYLIVWVIDQFDRAIKWDGLLGEAVVRSTADDAGAYNGIPIQAASSLSPGTAAIPTFTDVDKDGSLDFDGREYKAVTGTVIVPVRYDEPSTAIAPATASSVTTSLVLLTLDVRSNRPNTPLFVEFDCYNQYEIPTSVSHEFVCWSEVTLSRIDENLSRTLQGSRKGYCHSGPAWKEFIYGIDPENEEPYATLLGIVFTRERGTAGTVARSYSYSMFNDGYPVKTTFEPKYPTKPPFVPPVQ